MIPFAKILPNCRSVLCLDGTLPYGLIRRMGLPILAADGAANRLIRRGLEPRMILGDLDSVEPQLLPGRKFLKVFDQNRSDFEKALRFAQEVALTPTAVTGIDGGFLDHVFGNFSILSQTCSCFFSRNVLGLLLEEIFRTDALPLRTKISLFGAPQCRVRSRGLRWELQGQELSFGGMMSLGNRTCSSPVELRVLSGKALVFIHAQEVHDAGCLLDGS
ncbi:MAG: thiamine diphosphokinase [Puniceicoccales bacterium]|jgi:thiamine pyrophosphokinase|nr:thiamine diphosphokinase [Puniceicoccales bacterium]